MTLAITALFTVVWATSANYMNFAGNAALAIFLGATVIYTSGIFI